MASGILWTSRVIEEPQTNVTPGVETTATYNFTRTGTKLNLDLTITQNCMSNGAWYDYRWACDIYVNNKTIKTNMQIKPTTPNNQVIGRTPYTVSTGNMIIDIGTAPEVVISIFYYDTWGSQKKHRHSFETLTRTLPGVPALPIVSLNANYSYPNMTDSSLMVNYSITGGPCDYITVYVDGQSIGNKNNSPFVVTGLASNKNHTIYAKGYGTGGYGDNSNNLNFTTFLTPTYVSSFSEGNINPFSCTAYCNSNNASNTMSYEYALCDSSHDVINGQGPFISNVTYYEFSGLEEETTYCIRYRVRTIGSGAWSEYVYGNLFTTPADQARGYIKKDGVWVQGKIYIKKDGSWVKAKKAYIKKDGSWIISRNN